MGLAHVQSNVDDAECWEKEGGKLFCSIMLTFFFFGYAGQIERDLKNIWGSTCHLVSITKDSKVVEGQLISKMGCGLSTSQVQWWIFVCVAMRNFRLVVRALWYSWWSKDLLALILFYNKETALCLSLSIPLAEIPICGPTDFKFSLFFSCAIVLGDKKCKYHWERQKCICPQRWKIKAPIRVED